MATRRKPNPAALAPNEVAPEVIAPSPEPQWVGIVPEPDADSEAIERAFSEAEEQEAAELPPTTIQNMDLTLDQMPAETEGRESHWPVKTERRTVLVPHTEEHLADIAGRMSEIIMEREEVKLRAKNAASGFKAQVDELDERLGEHARTVESGGSERSVPCTWVFETFGKDTSKFSSAHPNMPVETTEDGLIRHPEFKTLVRDDNGDVVETALITTQERQMDLSLLHEVPAIEVADDGAADLDLDLDIGDGPPITDQEPELFGDETHDETADMTPDEKASYSLGWGAWDMDCTKDENPYPVDSAQAAAWLKGWTASKDATVPSGDA